MESCDFSDEACSNIVNIVVIFHFPSNKIGGKHIGPIRFAYS